MGMDIVCGFLLFLAFFLLGERILDRFRLDFSDNAEVAVFSLSLGAITVSLTTTLLAFLGALYPPIAWVLLGAVFLGCFGRLRNLFETFRSRLISPTSFPSVFAGCSSFEIFCHILFCALIVLALTLAISPPVATDALVYHLAVPKAYLEHHGIVNLPNNIYSYFPLHIEMIYLFSLMLKGDALAQFSGLGISLLLPAAMTIFYKRYLSDRCAALVPALFLATPAFWSGASAAYVDLPAAAFVFLAYYAWDRWRTTERDGWFLLASIFASAAVASKLTAIVALPLVFLGIVLQYRGDMGWIVGKVILLALAVLLFLAPWWARNFHYTGNPFAPFLMQIFGGEGRMNWDAQRSFLQFQYYKSFGMGNGIADFILLPFRLALSGEKDSLRFDGQIGIVYLLLVPGLFWLRQGRGGFPRSPETVETLRRIRHLACLVVVLLVFWFFQSQYVRLLPSCLAFLTLLAARGFAGMTGRGSIIALPKIRSVLLPVIVAAGLLYNTSFVAREWFGRQPLRYLAGMENRDEYLTRLIPSYPLFRTVNETLDKDATVLFVYMRNLGYLCERKFVSDTFFEGYTLKKLIAQGSSAAEMEESFRKAEITHVLFNNNYVFGKDSAFTHAELESLKNHLNARGRLVEQKNGFYLYRLW